MNPGRFRRDETLRVDAGGDKGGLERQARCLTSLIGELEGSPMDAECLPCADILEDPNGFFRIDMLGSHEPTWFISADRDQRQIGRAKLSDLLEDPTVA